MLVTISKVLATAGKSPADLSGVVVFSGPGSFTGLRVGITIANGIGRALGIGVRAVDEFQLTKKWWPQLDWVITPSTRTEIILGNRDGFTPMKPEAVAKKIRTGERVCLTTPGLLAIMHPFIKRAGTIRVAPVRTTERLELLSQFSTPKKYRQVLPQYGREPSISLPSKKR